MLPGPPDRKNLIFRRKIIMFQRKVSNFARWSICAAVMLAHTLAANGQNLTDPNIASTTAPVIFNFVSTPDVGSISSLSADKETDVWATSVTSSVRRTVIQNGRCRTATTCPCWSNHYFISVDRCAIDGRSHTEPFRYLQELNRS